MPKNKKKAESSSSDSDSGPEDKGPVKKAKTSNKSEEDEPSWAIDKRRFVKVREFKNKIYVDIREFYEANGELKPGKKGISLSTQQWNELKKVVDEVDDAIKHKS